MYCFIGYGRRGSSFWGRVVYEGVDFILGSRWYRLGDYLGVFNFEIFRFFNVVNYVLVFVIIEKLDFINFFVYS